jgi:hypothetical protein
VSQRMSPSCRSSSLADPADLAFGALRAEHRQVVVNVRIRLPLVSMAAVRNLPCFDRASDNARGSHSYPRAAERRGSAQTPQLCQRGRHARAVSGDRRWGAGGEPLTDQFHQADQPESAQAAPGGTRTDGGSGFTRPRGATGAQGPQGVAGPPGAAGSSASRFATSPKPLRG